MKLAPAGRGIHEAGFTQPLREKIAVLITVYIGYTEVEPLNDQADYRDALKKNYNFGMHIGRVITCRTV